MPPMARSRWASRPRSHAVRSGVVIVMPADVGQVGRPEAASAAFGEAVAAVACAGAGGRPTAAGSWRWSPGASIPVQNQQAVQSVTTPRAGHDECKRLAHAAWRLSSTWLATYTPLVSAPQIAAPGQRAHPVLGEPGVRAPARR